MTASIRFSDKIDILVNPEKYFTPGVLNNMEKPYVFITGEAQCVTSYEPHECNCKYCEHSDEHATQCSYIIHYKDKCDVTRGDKEKMMKIWNGLTLSNLSVTLEVV